MELDSSEDDSHASISGDGLTVVFCSNRMGGYDLWIATRESRSEPFSEPERIPALAQPEIIEVDPWISEDARTIYFGLGPQVSRKIYRSTRL